ncbi:MAG: diguanylate cyclase (GGDEF)-like protein [Flavobacteriales bacterium]|jgi:diguanylate cyclase (GGDEF)-like protein
MLTVPNNPSNVVLSRTWLLLIIIIFCTSVIFAVSNFSSTIRPAYTVVGDIEHLVDTNKQYSIASILGTPDNIWRQYNQDLTELEMSNELHWFRFSLRNTDSAQSRLLEIDNASLDIVNLWFIRNNKVLEEYQVGDYLPFSQRIIEHENFLFPVPTNGEDLSVYVSTYSEGVMRLPLNIWQQQDYLKFSSKNSLIMGGFFGLMLAMGLSNLFFFITTRSPTFLVYAGYVMFLGLTLSALEGLGYHYIWPNSPWLQQNSVVIFASLTVWLSIIFCDLLLNVRAYNTLLSKLLNIIAFAFLLNLIISLLVPLQVFIQVFLMMLCGSGIFILSVSIWLWIKGLTIARYYTLAWAFLFIGGFAVSLDTLNIISFDLPYYYLLMLGAGIEALILALILAISHNQQHQTLISTQAELLIKEQQAQHTQKGMLAFQENLTRELECKVQERTLELEVALRELSETNYNLQEINTLDALTGIRNRSFFNKKYQAEVRSSQREKTQLSVVMIDIDHFKNINDQYGHLVGDECIKTIATIFEKTLKRPSDDVCRYGGEEFAFILPCTDLEGALFLVEQLRVTIEKTSIHVDDVSVNITFSAGIGTAIADITQPEDSILALADKQLYAAKNAGRNNVQGNHLDPIQQQD